MGLWIRGPTGSTGATGAAGATGASGPTLGLIPFITTAAITGSGYLKIANALTSSATVGYVAHRGGYIMGISVQSDCTVCTSSGNFNIQAYVSGAKSFTAAVTVSGTGVVTGWDYDSGSKQEFSAGDILAMQVEYDGFVGTLTNTIAMAELKFT